MYEPQTAPTNVVLFKLIAAQCIRNECIGFHYLKPDRYYFFLLLKLRVLSYLRNIRLYSIATAETRA
mgnify:CR=1 FL=1